MDVKEKYKKMIKCLCCESQELWRNNVRYGEHQVTCKKCGFMARFDYKVKDQDDFPLERGNHEHKEL